MNIILAGMPGCGKTTVSNALAEQGFKVIDTDSEIVIKHGSISEIFDKFGEAHFRNIETETVKAVSALNGVVICTGGGCLLRKENAELLKKNGKIVYLRTSIETLTKRLEGDNSRPLLKGNVRERLEKLFKERAAIYENAADIIIDTDVLTPKELAQQIGKLL